MKKFVLGSLGLAMLLVLLAFGCASAAAPPTPLSATFSKSATDCGIWWFDPDWNLVWIEGQGRITRSASGGEVRSCRFTLNLHDPALLSRSDFCAEDWAAFMCRGDGALVDNRTTCNIEDAEVHNGVVTAGPSGQGMFVCHIK
jgi:hypothetical protein